MNDELRYLYPSLSVDRSLRARIRRAVNARSVSLRRHVLPVPGIVREVAIANGRSRLIVGAAILSAWARDGIHPRSFAANLLWEVPAKDRTKYLSAGEMEAFYSASIDPEDRALMRDKPAFADHSRRNGIPWPQTLAVVNRQEGPSIEDAVAVRSKESFRAVLEHLVTTRDVFLKPACGKQGRGVFRVTRGLRAIDGDGEEVPFDECVDSVFAYRHPVGAFGYIVQPVLEPHPRVIEITGVTALSTIRVTTAVCDGTPHTLQALLKIPAPGRLTDNFRDGVTGTMVAGLDPKTGCLLDVVGILRPGNRFVSERTHTHPSTGRVVTGHELPEWRSALALAHRAALLHPRTATLGWDIAITPSGCVFLDVNTMWSPSGSQVCWREGLRPTLARMFPNHFAQPAHRRR